jgi:hypothetical protein
MAIRLHRLDRGFVLERIAYHIRTITRRWARECLLRGNANPLIRGFKRLVIPAVRTGFLANHQPRIEVYQGLERRCGHLGMVQPDFNITGRVDSRLPLRKVSYSLNGGDQQLLAFKRSRRIVAYGEFNADIPVTTLRRGENRLLLSATDIVGHSTTVSVSIRRSRWGSYPLPARIVWRRVSDLDDVGLCTDGKWDITSRGLRTTHIGYDRIFLIGNQSWTDYEVLTTVTVHGMSRRNGPQSGSVKHVGFCMRWSGHSVTPGDLSEQPRSGLYPRGGLVWLTSIGGRLPMIRQFVAGDSEDSQNFHPFAVEFDKPFWMKGRCETIGPNTTCYSFKVWAQHAAEPESWDCEVVQHSPIALRFGGLALVAHELDATFGDVEISPLPEDLVATASTSRTALIPGGRFRRAAGSKGETNSHPAKFSDLSESSAQADEDSW